MIAKDVKSFSKFLFKFILEKPTGKWQTLAHIWDRAMVGVAGVLITITAFSTSNTGILILIVWGLAILIFGFWLVSKGK